MGPLCIGSSASREAPAYGSPCSMAQRGTTAAAWLSGSAPPHAQSAMGTNSGGSFRPPMMIEEAAASPSQAPQAASAARSSLDQAFQDSRMQADYRARADSPPAAPLAREDSKAPLKAENAARNAGS